VHLSHLAINRGGLTWKAFTRSQPSLAALLSIVYLPGLDNQTAAVEMFVVDVSAPGAERALAYSRIDLAQQATTVTLIGTNDRPVSWNKAELKIHSHARGTLSIANVTQTYTVK
jgi:hypothetical protein